MLSGLLLVACAFSGQTDGRTAYLFIFKDENRPTLLGYLSASEERNVDTMDGFSVTVLQPWSDTIRRERVLRRDLRDAPGRAEAAVIRRYIAEGWQRVGGKQVQAADGGRIWVHGDAKDRHDAALAMRASAFSEPPPLEALPVPQASAEAAGPGFLTLWGLHIALGTAGLIAAIVTTWWAFVRSPWSSVRP